MYTNLTSHADILTVLVLLYSILYVLFVMNFVLIIVKK
jgi:hypothetical protein